MSNQCFMRLWKIMTNPWVICAYISLVITSFLYIDKPLAVFLYSLKVAHHWPWLAWVTHLGLGGIYMVALFVLAVLCRLLRNTLWEARLWFLWLAVIGSATICLVIKVMMGRARPDLLFSNGYYGFYGFHSEPLYWSFPSGHTTNIMALVFGLTVLFPRWCFYYILLGVLIAGSRVLLLQHYLSDVLMAIGVAFLTTGWLRQRLQSIDLFRSVCR